MKRIEFGLFALCVLIGGYLGSMFGIALAVCAYMIVDGVIDEVRKIIKTKEKNKTQKEEGK